MKCVNFDNIIYPLQSREIKHLVAPVCLFVHLRTLSCMNCVTHDLDLGTAAIESQGCRSKFKVIIRNSIYRKPLLRTQNRIEIKEMATRVLQQRY